jgi:hypothetical protein
MIASCLNELSGVPRDSNGLNIIIGENQQGFTARYCDVEGIVRDTDSVQKEIKLLKESFGEFGTHFTDALQKGYAGDLLK